MKYLMNISGNIPHAGLSNINIPLNGRNLIITGRNGSGKTSFLMNLDKKLELHFTKKMINAINYQNTLNQLKAEQQKHVIGSPNYYQHQTSINLMLEALSPLQEGFNLNIENEHKLLVAYDNFQAIFKFFPAMRTATIKTVNSSTSIESEKQEAKNNKASNLGLKFEQHLVNIKINQSLAITEDNNTEQAKLIAEWFCNFDKHLKFLFENESTRLIFHRQNLKFKISLDGREFDFQTLSSGYLAIFDILADLLMRTEFYDSTPKELEGIVLIDEIDAHLHISLQKKILPFFIGLFPNIQFIFSTHSPFVITSTNDDTVVYDLTNGALIEDNLSNYSNEAITKGLFHVETNSDQLALHIKSIARILNEDSSNFEDLRKNLQLLAPHSKHLNSEAKSFYYKALNHLLDNQQLGNLDV